MIVLDVLRGSIKTAEMKRAAQSAQADRAAKQDAPKAKRVP